MADTRLKQINPHTCSTETYNFFGDVDILMAVGKATFEEAHSIIREVYDPMEWNEPNKAEEARPVRRPPMYK